MSTASDRLVPQEVRGTGRETLPAGFVAGGGSATIRPKGAIPRFISRRLERDFGWLGRSIGGRATLGVLAQTNPLRLLTHLPSLCPQADFAINQNLAIAIPPDGLPIVAVNEQKEVDAVGTLNIENLWKSLPNEIGGLAGLQGTQMLVGTLTGLCAIEAVPARKLNGVARAWPIDPLTLAFDRKTPDSDMTAYQRQSGNVQFKELRSTTFFWNAWNHWVDDPWGKSDFSTVLPEIIVDMALIQDIRDSVKNQAWPRKAVPFNWENTYKIAKDVFHLNDLEKAKEFVANQFDMVRKKLKEIQPDEDLVYDSSNGNIVPLTGGGYAGIEPVIKFFQQRIFWGLKKLPSMMGFAEDTSESFSTLSWVLQALELEKMRAFIVDPLVQVAQLHLDLQGIPLTAVAKYPRLRTTDALVEAQTRSIEIQNELLLWMNGAQSQEQFSVKLTGSKPDRAMAEPKSMGNPNGNAAGGQGAAGQNPSGQTSNEQNALQKRGGK